MHAMKNAQLEHIITSLNVKTVILIVKYVKKEPMKIVQIVNHVLSQVNI